MNDVYTFSPSVLLHFLVLDVPFSLTLSPADSLVLNLHSYTLRSNIPSQLYTLFRPPCSKSPNDLHTCWLRRYSYIPILPCPDASTWLWRDDCRLAGRLLCPTRIAIIIIDVKVCRSCSLIIVWSTHTAWQEYVWWWLALIWIKSKN